MIICDTREPSKHYKWADKVDTIPTDWLIEGSVKKKTNYRNGKWVKCEHLCKNCGLKFIGEKDRVFCSKKCAYIWLKTNKGYKAWNKGKKCPNISKSKKKYKFTAEHLNNLTRANREIWKNKTDEQKKEQIKRFENAGHLALKRICEQPLEYANDLILDNIGAGKYKMLVDSQEPSKMKDRCSKLEGIDVKVCKLPIGDYWLIGESAVVVVERKEVSDFVGSIYDGRLFNQAKLLKETEKAYGIIPLVVLEGDFNKMYRKNYNKASVIGAELSLIVDWGVPIYYSPSMSWTVYLLVLLFNEFIGKRMTEYVRPMIRKGERTIAEERQDVVAAISGVGRKTSEKLVDDNHSIYDFVELIRLYRHEPESRVRKLLGKNFEHVKEVVLGE